MSELPPIAELVPHAGPMLLLHRLLECGDEHVVCEVLVRSDGLFDSAGRVPAWLGIEYMAQAVAAFSGMQAHSAQESVKLGVLLGTRRFETNVQDFACGDVLRVTARRLIHSSSGMGAFECEVQGDCAQQSARLSVYQPPDASDFVSP
tara:strand:- start:5250 stop:5693 length:444 start_codon:yes stop_codon:yes gene_type:complete